MAAKVKHAKNGSWYVYVDFNRYRKCKKFNTQKAAERAAQYLNESFDIIKARNLLDEWIGELRDTRIELQTRGVDDIRPGEGEIPDALSDLSNQLLNFPISLFRSAVYFLCLGNDVVYVGRTINLVKRMHEHKLAKEKRFDRILYVPASGREAIDLEFRYIDLLKPKHNKFRVTMATGGVPDLEETRQ